MLETTDRQGTPLPQAPTGVDPSTSSPDLAAGNAALAALPAPEPVEPEPPRRRRGFPRGLRLVVRCRPKSRPGLSLLARLAGRHAGETALEAPETLSERPSASTPETAATAREGALSAMPLNPEDPLGLLEATPGEEAWDLDLFADVDAASCGELDGPVTWALPEEEVEALREPQDEEVPEPKPEAIEPADPPPVAADQGLLLADLGVGLQAPPQAIEPLAAESVEPVLAAEALPEPEAGGNPELEAEALPQAQRLLSAEPIPEAEPVLDAEPIVQAEGLAEAEADLATEPMAESAVEPIDEPATATRGDGEALSCFDAVHGQRPAPADSFAWSAPAKTAHLPGVAAWALPALLPAVLAWLAPPIAGALVAGLAAALGAFIRRPNRHVRQATLALAWAGLALAAAAAAGSLLAPASLALPGVPWSWSGALLGPGALAGLAAVAAAGLLMPGRGAARLAALAGPGAGALAVALAGASPTSSLLAGAALCAGALEGSSRLSGWRRAPQRFHLRAWAIAGAGAIAAALVATLLAGAAPPAAAVLLALTALGATTAHRTLGLGDEARPTALLLGAGALAATTTSLVVAGLWAGLTLPAALSLSLLAPAAAQAERWRRSQAWKQAIPDPPGLAFLARTATAGLTVLVAVALVLESGPVAWTVAAATLLLLSAICAAERVLGGPAGFALAGIGLGSAAGCALLLEAGLPVTWLPACLTFGFAAPLLSGERLPGRTRRSDWDRPVLGAAALGLGLSLLICLHDPAAGLAGVLAATTAPLLLLGSSRLARRTAPLFLGLVPVAAALAFGAWTWAVPLLGLASFVVWALSRRHGELLPAAAVLATSAGLLAWPLAMAGHWQAAGSALLALGLLGATDFLDSTGAGQSRERAAAGLGTYGLGGAAGIAAAALAGPALPAVLLAAAVLVQATDLITSDGRLSRWLRPASTLAWLAGFVAIAPQAVSAPARGAALVGAAAAAALLLALLRRERAPAFVAGLCAATATGLVSLAAGLDPSLAPALFLAPAAVWAIAWGIFESVENRDPNAYLTGGLGLLGAGVLLQVHATDVDPAWRVAVLALGMALLLGGAATKHRVPVLLGAGLLFLEGLVLLVAALRLGTERPWLLAAVLLGLAGGLATGAWQLCRRAGSRAALRLAWHGDWLRAVEQWRRWS